MDNMDNKDIDYTSDIIDIQRNFYAENREPTIGERVHVEDPDKSHILRQYVYTIQDGINIWIFEKTIQDTTSDDITNQQPTNDNNKNTKQNKDTKLETLQDNLTFQQSKTQTTEDNSVPKKRTYTRKNKKNTYQQELQNILNLLNINKIQDAIVSIQHLVNLNNTDNTTENNNISNSHLKPIKKTRAKTEYNKFISEQLHKIKIEQPELSTAQRMKYAVENWHTFKSQLTKELLSN